MNVKSKNIKILHSNNNEYDIYNMSMCGRGNFPLNVPKCTSLYVIRVQ